MFDESDFDQASQRRDAGDRRLDLRHDFTGAHIRLLTRKAQHILHLKDLSCTGLCGLTDAPIAPGQRVMLMFSDHEPFEAEIRWVRKALFGAVLIEPLALKTMQRLRRHRKRRDRRQ